MLHKVRLPAAGTSVDDQLNTTASQADDSVSMAGSQSSFLDDGSSMHHQTRLDSTVAIEHKTKHNAEFHVKAIVSKRLVFKSRPKPIIANVAKQV